MPDPDPKLIASLPEELRDLPFGSPEFKDANERIAQADMDACAETMRAMPTWVNLTGTTVCNLKCFMCNQALDPNIPKWFMSEAVYERCVEELYPFAKMVQFSAFGEPLMTPKLDSKLDDLDRTNTRLDIVTNATLMKDQKTRDKLLRVLGSVIFSLDGATAETYNQIRIGSDFDRVMANIEAFCESRRQLPEAARPRLGFNFILMHKTIHEAAKFVELAHSLGAQQVTFNHMVVFDDSLKHESLQFHQELSNEHLTAAREAADRLGVPVTMPPLFRPAKAAAPDPGAENAAAVATEPLPTPRQADGPGMPTVKCMFLWKRVYISVNGEVVPCCLAGIPAFGNMMDDGFQAVWNGETYRTYRRHVYTDSPHGMCRNCYLIYPSPDQVEEEAFLKY